MTLYWYNTLRFDARPADDRCLILVDTLLGFAERIPLFVADELGLDPLPAIRKRAFAPCRSPRLARHEPSAD
jgi:hypothetical protein